MPGAELEVDSRFSWSRRTPVSWFLEAWGIISHSSGSKLVSIRSSGPRAGGDVGLLYLKALGPIPSPATPPPPTRNYISKFTWLEGFFSYFLI